MKNILKPNTGHLKLVLNKFKGLSIHEVSFKKHNFVPLIRSFPAGSFDNINYGVDFFSGSLICNIPTMRLKNADLKKLTHIYPLMETL